MTVDSAERAIHHDAIALLREAADVLTDVRSHAHARNCPDCPLLIGDLLSRIMGHLNAEEPTGA